MAAARSWSSGEPPEKVNVATPPFNQDTNLLVLEIGIPTQLFHELLADFVVGLADAQKISDALSRSCESVGRRFSSFGGGIEGGFTPFRHSLAGCFQSGGSALKRDGDTLNRTLSDHSSTLGRTLPGHGDSGDCGLADGLSRLHGAISGLLGQAPIVLENPKSLKGGSIHHGRLR